MGNACTKKSGCWLMKTGSSCISSLDPSLPTSTLKYNSKPSLSASFLFAHLPCWFYHCLISVACDEDS